MPTIDGKPPLRRTSSTTKVEAEIKITAPVLETSPPVLTTLTTLTTPEVRSGADPLQQKLGELGAKDQATVRSTFSRLFSLFGGASQIPTTTLPRDVAEVDNGL